MKKILIDLSALYNIYSGLGQVALSYGRYFEKHYKADKAGYRLYLLLPKKYFGAFGSEIHYISSDSWWRRHSRYLFPKIDVWHSIDQITRFKPYSTKTKHIITIHDLNYLYEEKDAKKRATAQRRIQRTIKRTNQIVCISDFTKREVERNFRLDGKLCRVIYNHVKPLDVSRARKPDIDIRTPFFFAIGVLAEKKNFHVLLDLMKLLPEKHLYIAGKDNYVGGLPAPYADMIRKRIDIENIDNITLMGGISDEEKIWMYRHCEAFLIPSLLEGFGLPVVEAMQAGKPVFSSPKTSLEEIGNRFAFFWNNFDAQTMKKVIDDNLEEFYRNASLIEEQRKYAASFATDRHFEEYEQLYSTI